MRDCKNSIFSNQHLHIILYPKFNIVFKKLFLSINRNGESTKCDLIAEENTPIL